MTTMEFAKMYLMCTIGASIIGVGLVWLILSFPWVALLFILFGSGLVVEGGRKMWENT